MNEKQAKLMRYFVKNTGKPQLKMAAAFIAGWDTLNHKKKGALTKWIKEAIVIAMHMKQRMQDEQEARNAEIIAGLASKSGAPVV